MIEQNLEEKTNSNNDEMQSGKTDWPATAVFYGALVPYIYGGAKIMEGMVLSESKIQEALFPLAFIGYVGGVFVLRGAIQITSNLTRNFFYRTNDRSL